MTGFLKSAEGLPNHIVSPVYFRNISVGTISTIGLLLQQFRFGDKLVNFQVVCPLNRTAVLKGVKPLQREPQSVPVRGQTTQIPSCVFPNATAVIKWSSASGLSQDPSVVVMLMVKVGMVLLVVVVVMVVAVAMVVLVVVLVVIVVLLLMVIVMVVVMGLVVVVVVIVVEARSLRVDDVQRPGEPSTQTILKHTNVYMPTYLRLFNSCGNG